MEPPAESRGNASDPSGSRDAQAVSSCIRDGRCGDGEESDEGEDVDADDDGIAEYAKGPPMTQVRSEVPTSDGRSAAVHRVFTRNGELGFWAIMLPLPPGVQPADIPRHMENLVDQVQPGLWQKGRCAGDCFFSLPPRAGRTRPFDSHFGL